MSFYGNQGHRGQVNSHYQPLSLEDLMSLLNSPLCHLTPLPLLKPLLPSKPKPDIIQN